MVRFFLFHFNHIPPCYNPLIMFSRLFIKKANFERIQKILDKEGFIYELENIHALLKGNQKGIRYGNIVLPRNESGKRVKRFLKIMLDGSQKTFKPFRRQVNIAAALNADSHFKSPSIAVIASSLKPPVSYAIFETRENGDGFGFMNDNPLFYKNITEENIHTFVSTLYTFHQAGAELSKKTLGYAKEMSGNISTYRKELKKLLNKRIQHKDAEGVISDNTVEFFLISYTGIPDMAIKIMNVLEDNWKFVLKSKTKRKTYLVHADMQIDNIYKHKNGEFELLDFEWVGKSNSPLIAIMYDYGNLRARAWSSPSFQNLLDQAMIEIGKTYYDEAWVNAGMKLGIVRSSLMMSRYHLDFENTVKKDRRTEDDYRAMYPRTIESLVEGIQ